MSWYDVERGLPFTHWHGNQMWFHDVLWLRKLETNLLSIHLANFQLTVASHHFLVWWLCCTFSAMVRDKNKHFLRICLQISIKYQSINRLHLDESTVMSPDQENCHSDRCSSGQHQWSSILIHPTKYPHHDGRVTQTHVVPPARLISIHPMPKALISNDQRPVGMPSKFWCTFSKFNTEM